jgi:phospholipid/cholesterol/gamma-HCH transport system ATP-binding protein
MPEVVIELSKVATHFGTHIVHSCIDLQIKRGEVFALIGGSGSGKSTLLREMILLQKPNAGSIHVLGQELSQLNKSDALLMRKRWGVMFQHGGLLGALNILENVGLPLREHTALKGALIDDIAQWKLSLTGLNSDVHLKIPSELSGGMLKRASFARALALDPELLFLDEPTAGLDPESAAGVDGLVLKLREIFGLTIVMITHDLELLWQVADRVAVLADGKVQLVGSMSELSNSENPSVKRFFDSPRGRAAQSIQIESKKEKSSKLK